MCWLVVIPLSWLVRGSPRLYRYLWRSVLAFDATTDSWSAARNAPDSSPSSVEAVAGWQRGILHTLLGLRPL